MHAQEAIINKGERSTLVLKDPWNKFHNYFWQLELISLVLYVDMIDTFIHMPLLLHYACMHPSDRRGERSTAYFEK